MAMFLESFVTSANLRSLVIIVVVAITFMLMILALKAPYTTIAHKSWLALNETHLLQMLKLSGPPQNEVKTNETCVHPVSPLSTIENINSSQVLVFPKEETIAKAKKHIKSDVSAFYPIMNLEMKLKLLNTYLVMAKALEQAGIPYYVADGSLLGIYRMSGILPWDDDLDIVISLSFWKKVQDILICIQGFELLVDDRMRWVFFSSTGNYTEVNKAKKYPFIDIFFYQEDPKHIIILHWVQKFRVVFPKDIIFPLSIATMDGLRVPVPHDINATLNTAFDDLNLCTSQETLHNQRKHDYKMKTLPCSTLYPMYGHFRLPASSDGTAQPHPILKMLSFNFVSHEIFYILFVLISLIVLCRCFIKKTRPFVIFY